MLEKPFEWDEEKNRFLQSERGLSFEGIIIAIQNGHLIDIKDHLVRQNQKVFEVLIEGYIVRVPFVEDEKKIFLKTAFHSRKATKKHLGKKNHEH
jgi:uncharacterized DUF497 family protein